MANLVLTKRFPRGEPDNTATFAAGEVSTFNTNGVRWAATDMWSRAGTTTLAKRLIVDARRVPPPDDTPWIRKAASDFSTIGQRWPAIEAWQQRGETIRPKRYVVNPVRVPPSDNDSPWIRKADSDFDAIGQLWPALDSWRSDTTRPKRLIFDPRRLPADDTGVSWFAANAASIVASQWPAIDAWNGQADRTPGRVPNPRPTIYVDDAWMGALAPPAFDPALAVAAAAWIQAGRTVGRTWFRASMPGVSSGTGVAFDASPYLPAIQGWLDAFRTPKSRFKFPDQGDAWSFAAIAPDFAQLFPAYEFRLERLRERGKLDPRRQWAPDDSAWIWFANQTPITFSAANWPSIEAWDLRRTRGRPLLDARLVPPPDDAPWIWFANQGPPVFSAANWPAIESWRSDFTTVRGPRLDPRRIWTPDDTAWERFAANAFAAVGQQYAAIDAWSRALRTAERDRVLRQFILPGIDNLPTVATRQFSLTANITATGVPSGNLSFIAAIHGLMGTLFHYFYAHGAR